VKKKNSIKYLYTWTNIERSLCESTAKFIIFIKKKLCSIVGTHR